MKKIIVFLFLFLLSVLISCKSTVNNNPELIDTLKQDSNYLAYNKDVSDVVIYNSVVLNEFPSIPDSNVVIDELITTLDDVDTVKKPLSKKEIRSIQVDSTWKVRKDSSYRQLQKTEKKIIEQQKRVDSILIIRKKEDN